MTIAPALAAGIGLFSSVASVGLGVASSIVGAASARESAKQAEELAKKNKQIAEDNAVRALVSAQQDSYEQDLLTAQQLGEQEAIQAGSGLSVDSKSFQLTRATARALGRQDAVNMRDAGAIRAQAYRTEGDAYAAEAVAARRAQGNAVLGGFLGAASSIIGGAGLIAVGPTRTNQTVRVPGASLL